MDRIQNQASGQYYLERTRSFPSRLCRLSGPTREAENFSRPNGAFIQGKCFTLKLSCKRFSTPNLDNKQTNDIHWCIDYKSSAVLKRERKRFGIQNFTRNSFRLLNVEPYMKRAVTAW